MLNASASSSAPDNTAYPPIVHMNRATSGEGPPATTLPNTSESTPLTPSSHSPLANGPLTDFRKPYAAASSSTPVTNAHATIRYEHNWAAAETE